MIEWGKRLTNLSFEQWVAHIFDHPVTDPAWHFDLNSEWWDSSSEERINYLTQLFESDGTILAAYTDAQLNQGFWYLVGTASGDYFRELKENSVPLPDRIRCIESIFNLYKQVFAVRCSSHLSNIIRSKELEPEGLSPLNSICYMWWDIAPLYPDMEVDNLQLMREAILNVMRKTLELDSIACQESALHGLGHWDRLPETTNIIGNWFKNHKDVPDELRLYAIRAQSGGVL